MGQLAVLSVSPSSQTAERGACCPCGDSSSAVTTHGRVAFDSDMRKESHGVDSARHPSVGERLPRDKAIAKKGPKRWVVRRKEEVASGAGLVCQRASEIPQATSGLQG